MLGLCDRLNAGVAVSIPARRGWLAPVTAAVAAFALAAAPAVASAKTWYVRSGAASGGDGTRAAPFASLAAVQRASAPGDTIVVEPVPASAAPLDGGIALKPGQKLTGGGPAVAGHTATLSALPVVTNTTSTNISGDAVRLADRATVHNLVVRRAYRGDIYGLDSVGARVIGNDVSGQNSSCTNGFLVQPFNVPTAVPFVDVPASPAVAPQNGWAGIMVDGSTATGAINITGNFVHDGVCGDGIDIRAMGASDLTATVANNTVTRLPQGSASSISSVLGIGMQALDNARLRVTQNRNTETYVGSPGANADSEFANVAGSGVVIDNLDHNTMAHGIGGTSTNGFETIISSGSGTIAATVRDSTFKDNEGDMFEEGNLGSGSTMRFIAENVLVDGTHVRGAGFPGASDGGANPIPFNIGDCMILGDDGANDSTTFVMDNSTFKGCNEAIAAGHNAGAGNGVGIGEGLVVKISHSVISGNAKYGLHVFNVTPLNDLDVNVDHTLITANGEPGASIEAGPFGITENPAIDFGGGTLGSAGQNCFYGNGTAHVQGLYASPETADIEATNYTVTADDDWWGQPGPPKPGQTATHLTGAINTDSGLPSPPACGLTTTDSRTEASASRAGRPRPGG